MVEVARMVPATPAAVWNALVDTTMWPLWGPSVRRVSLDHPGIRVRRGSRGRVQTVVGAWLPFEITDWDEGRRWGWKVAGISATGHRVEPGPRPESCSAVIEVPAWAILYAPLCWVAIGRIGALAAGGAG